MVVCSCWLRVALADLRFDKGKAPVSAFACIAKRLLMLGLACPCDAMREPFSLAKALQSIGNMGNGLAT
jgi:hypothetical protein